MYDVVSDPLEEKNLAMDPAFKPQLESMRGRWRKWREHLEVSGGEIPFLDPV